MLHANDLELKLLSGFPLDLNESIKIHPIKLKDVVMIGEMQYNYYLSKICLDIENLLIDEKLRTELNNQGITSYLLILSQCFNNENILNDFLKAMSFFLKQKVVFLDDFGIFYIGEKDLEEIKDSLKGLTKLEELDNKSFITQNNFDAFKDIIKLQNCLKKVSDQFNPINERAKNIIEKMKIARQKVNRAKTGEQEPLNLSDLISVFCAFNKTMAINQVWEMTFYQFDNQFKRTQLIHDYEISVQSLLHGADSKKVKIENFMSKIE